jgi:ParB family chromosome partitioning protein
MFMEIIEIDPRVCKRWQYADRNSFEFGDTNILAEDIKRNGQITPVFVRTLKDNGKFKYEVIAGSRRLQACLAADIPLKAILTSVSDIEAATIQIKENEQLGLSEYSRGLSFAKLKQDGKLTQEQLAEIAGCSRKRIQNLLAFEKIDKAIWNAVTNMSKVSARSAETILALSKKSTVHKEALIEIAEEIRKGAGSVRIEKLVDEILNGQFGKEEEQIITNPAGQVLAKWKDGKLYFAKDLKLDKNRFNKMLVDFFNIEN